jgi:hypothetical protein
MRYLLTIAILLALVAGGAEAPPEATWTPDARIFYESDTRAYYRPCG